MTHSNIIDSQSSIRSLQLISESFAIFMEFQCLCPSIWISKTQGAKLAQQNPRKLDQWAIHLMVKQSNSVYHKSSFFYDRSNRKIFHLKMPISRWGFAQLFCTTCPHENKGFLVRFTSFFFFSLLYKQLVWHLMLRIALIVPASLTVLLNLFQPIYADICLQVFTYLGE